MPQKAVSCILTPRSGLLFKSSSRALLKLGPTVSFLGFLSHAASMEGSWVLLIYRMFYKILIQILNKISC